MLQVQKRVWAHTWVADTFTALVYSRPTVVDRSFCDLSLPDEFSDMKIPTPLRECVQSLNDDRPLSRMTYHIHRYRLYEIASQIVSQIYTLRARASFSPQFGGVEKLVSTVRSLDDRLKQWYNDLPAFFKQSSWKEYNECRFRRLDGRSEEIPISRENMKHQLKLQAILLQGSYDNILLVLHRPLLEYRMSSHKKGRLPQQAAGDPFTHSFNTCIAAAMRISRTSLTDFQYDPPLALMSMYLFTSGVLLCIPDTIKPFGPLAHQAKGAVVRIIRAFKKLFIHKPIATQSRTTLEELMKIVLRREFDLVSQPEEHDNNPEQETGSDMDVEIPVVTMTGTFGREQPYPRPVPASGPLSDADKQSPRRSRCHHQVQSVPSSRSSGWSHDYWEGGQDPSIFGRTQIPPSVNQCFDPFRTYQTPAPDIPFNAYADNQGYADLDAEPDHEFTSAFEALDKGD